MNIFKRFGLATALLTVASFAQSSVIYTHTAGNYGGSIPSSISPTWVTAPMSVSFTTAAPLAANLVSSDIRSSIVSWTAGAGAPQTTISDTLAGSGISYMNVSTNAAGAITNWQLQFFAPRVSNTLDPLIEYVQSQSNAAGVVVLDQIQFLRAANGFLTGTLVTSTLGATGFISTELPASGGGVSSGNGGTGTPVNENGGSQVPVPASLALLALGLFGLVRSQGRARN
jgi:hypothetical protein